MRQPSDYLRGWGDAASALWQKLRGLALPEQVRTAILGLVASFRIDESLLKPRPTNAELAAKYAISPRTVVNWRREGCPFDEGQWRVLDWMAERRYVPTEAKAKFRKHL